MTCIETLKDLYWDFTGLTLTITIRLTWRPYRKLEFGPEMNHTEGLASKTKIYMALILTDTVKR